VFILITPYSKATSMTLLYRMYTRKITHQIRHIVWYQMYTLMLKPKLHSIAKFTHVCILSVGHHAGDCER